MLVIGVVNGKIHHMVKANGDEMQRDFEIVVSFAFICFVSERDS